METEITLSVWKVAALAVAATLAVVLWGRRAPRRIDMKVGGDVSTWRSGSGIFSVDTLDAEAALAEHQRREAVLREAVEEARSRRRKARKWAWLPWSSIRRFSITCLRWDLDIAQTDALRLLRIAEAYKTAWASGRPYTLKECADIEHERHEDAVAMCERDRLLSPTDQMTDEELQGSSPRGYMASVLDDETR